MLRSAGVLWGLDRSPCSVQLPHVCWTASLCAARSLITGGGPLPDVRYALLYSLVKVNSYLRAVDTIRYSASSQLVDYYLRAVDTICCSASKRVVHRPPAQL